MRPLALLLTLLAAPAFGDGVPIPDKEDPRIVDLHYLPGEALHLQVQVGSELTVLLPPGELPNTISAPTGWDVREDDRSGKVTIRPERPVPDTTMSVQTATHSYKFMLSDTPGAVTPVLVRLIGPDAPTERATDAAEPSVPGSNWHLSGKRELWPSSIRDDGAKTYLQWKPDQAIPAVFALDRLGREEMVDGYMRGDTFTIDRVYQRLLFRIDHALANARRKGGGASR